MIKNMKTLILNEDKLNTLKSKIIEESYCDKVLLVKKFLDGNFMRGTIEKTGDDGTMKKTGIFIQLDDKHMPTQSRLAADGVFDMIQDKFKNILSDKNERNKFLVRLIKDWYNNKITKDGTLSAYDF
jgi:hypothetical protein